jgi:RNA polymerase sigma-70 factor (ECF subfamily)
VSHFEQQVRQYQDRVFGFAQYFMKNREAAQDVTQDVLIRFWEHHEDVDEDRALGWLLRVTRNACIDALRKRKTRRNAVTVDTEGLDRATSTRTAPDAEAEAADFRDHLEEALDHVDEPYRSVIILREIQNLKYREISEALDMPMNTVKVYVHRGRKKLRKQLAELIEHETA